MAGTGFAVPQYTFFNNGQVAASGSVYVYQTGTTTPVTIYADAANTVPITNPINLDVNGQCKFYVSGSVNLRLDAYSGTNGTGSFLESIDPVYPVGGSASLPGNNTITNAMLAQAVGFSVKGNSSGSLANVSDLTSLVLSGTISATGGIVGTILSSNAISGSVGEYITSSATGVSLVNNTPANISIIPITAGDWEVWGSVNFVPASSTTVTYIINATNITSATLPSLPDPSYFGINASFNTGATQQINSGVKRYAVSATTTIYLVAQSGFAVSSMTASGIINARRRR